eukprot:5974698-Amphidinium_carterae.1
MAEIPPPPGWVSEGCIVHTFGRNVEPSLMEDIVYTQATLLQLSGELQVYINGQAIAHALTPIEAATVGNLGQLLVERTYAVLFQRSRWCKSYYFPALVTAAPAQHPSFRVQNGTKVPYWAITAFDSLGLRPNYEHQTNY